jgi:hypothetical protein
MADQLFSTKRVARPGGNVYFDKVNSHAADLYNERLAILWYMLDMDSILLNQTYSKEQYAKTKSILFQLWKNIRTLVRNNIHCRRILGLETKEPGVYTIDVAFNAVDSMYLWCENDRKEGFTYQRLYIMAEHLNRIELILRDVLQYFQYFMRTEYKQLPDILQAAETYKQYADKLTVEQLKEIIGKRNKIDFEGLGLVFEDDETAMMMDDDMTDEDEEIIEAEALEKEVSEEVVDEQL